MNAAGEVAAAAVGTVAFSLIFGISTRRTGLLVNSSRLHR